MPERKNIVLITLDSLRADHCSFMGYHRETTPTIDKMARRGLYFENAIASSVPTGPSMFGVFTGDYAPISATNYDGKLWRKEIALRKTLMDVLNEKKYETIALNTNPFTSRYFGFDKGFSRYFDLSEKGRSENIGTSSKLKRFYLNVKKVILKSDTLMTWESIYDTILQTLKTARQPFFVWIILLDTHTPYIPPKNHRKYCNSSFLRLLYLYWKLDRARWRYEGTILEVIDAYDDAIRYADKFINSLWKDLVDLDPIFIIHADHGDGLGEHGFYHHPPMLYEELIHVPLVIYNADIKGKIENPVSLRSLAPTILELVGVNNEFSSKSLFDYNENEWVISQVYDEEKLKIAVRMRDWKFITGQKEEDELYYLKKDPHEQENVIDEHPDLAREMRKIVDRHTRFEAEKKKAREGIQKLKRLRRI